MRVHTVGLLATAALAVCAAPARAQNFMSGSAETIAPGYFRLTGSPVQMFGHNGAPDRTGGEFRLGYGITDAFDIEAKSAFFDGVSLLGADAQVRVYRSDKAAISLRAGAHQAVMSSAPDSTAVDLAAELSAWVSRRVEVYGATDFSFEYVNGPGGNDFTRVHLVPGVRFGVGQQVDVQVEAGIGLNHNSPDFVTAGLAVHLPTSGAASSPRH